MPVAQVLAQKHIFGRQIGRSHLSGKLRSAPTAVYKSALGQGRGRPQGSRTSSSFDSTGHDVARVEESAITEHAVATCSRPVTLVTGSSTLLTAGAAAASGDSPGMSCMQPAWVESASHAGHAIILADFNLLPSFNGQPFQILGFLLNHPFITLALALTVNYIVPRAFRAVVRFLVFPLVLGSIAWVALQNPSTALDLLRGTFDFVTHHTIETSAVILIGLSFLLSPYLLVGGAVFLLLFGVPNIPAFMRPLVPAPLLEVQRRADEVQKGLQGPLKALGDGIGSTADGIQKTFGVKLLQ